MLKQDTRQIVIPADRDKLILSESWTANGSVDCNGEHRRAKRDSGLPYLVLSSAEQRSCAVTDLRREKNSETL